MKEWFKEHIVELIVGTVAVFGYFGVLTADLLGMASYASYIMLFVYIAIGVFIGWGLHRYRNNRGGAFSIVVIFHLFLGIWCFSGQGVLGCGTRRDYVHAAAYDVSDEGKHLAEVVMPSSPSCC